MNDANSAKEGIERPWRNREILEKLYHRKGLTQREIASRLDCNRGTVARWMDRLGVEARNYHHGRADFKTTGSGHEVWYFRDLDDRKQIGVHQLVAIMGGEDPWRVFSDNTHVHHKNGIPFDNRPENLETMTASEHVRRHHERGDF